MEHVYIGLGANVGNAVAQIAQAVELLAEHASVIQQSPLYETRPFGGIDQPNFINGAVHIETELSAEALHDWLKDIERRLGRVATVRNGPRPIDLDILLYGEHVIVKGNLWIPHRDMLHRDFVLRPLVDIGPDLFDPRTGLLLADVLREHPNRPAEDQFIIRKVEP